MKTLTLKSPLDMHLHLRDGEMLTTTVPCSSRTFAGALIMPNTVPPITDEAMLNAYKSRIEAQSTGAFEPYMTLFFKEDYSKVFLQSVKDKIIGIKLYPSGITTNSEGGVKEILSPKAKEVFGYMQELEIPLCVHGETNGFVMDREAEFGSIYEAMASEFPKLTIIMEHITTAHSVTLLEKYENLHATITLHHLLITLDDVAGGMLRPHLFCKPIAKRYEDRSALVRVALDAHPKVMFGSDSAPHPKEKKEAPGCAAGVFTAPIALAKLAELFDSKGKLENLQAFVSDNACRIYKKQPLKKEITLVNTPMDVPESYGEVVPMYGGEQIGWSVQEAGA